MTRTFTLIAALVAAAGFALPAGAADEHQHPAPDASAPAAATTASAVGEVRKVDAAAGKITIKHGWIRSVDMPPMTMAYAVKDKAGLGKLKAGDKIKFEVERAGEVFTILSIEKAE